MTLTGTIITYCWVIWAVFWFASAFLQKRIEKRISSFWGILQYLLIFIPVILLVRYNIFNFTSIVLVKTTLFINILSIFLCVVGLALTLLARIYLSGNWSGAVVLKKGHELIQKGPYRFIRHPIYSGMCLMFLGTAFAVGRIGGFIGFAIFFLGLWFKSRQEERLMIKHFGRKYLDYKKRTKALIPYVF
jgi:protein-S-isoprenylcysteine O-methyltransferase Ste14